jgi:phage host-nuclease inhibitor protein Gam
MTKRIKPAVDAPTIKSLEDADSALAEIAAMKRQIGLVEAAMNERIDRCKAEAAKDAEPYRLHLATLEHSLLRFADYNRVELFSSRKSVALTFGTIGYRASTKIKLLAKMTWERVLQELRDNGLRMCIRVKEEPDKEALKGLGEDILRSLGCKIVQEDVFFYETEEQDLAAPAAPGAAA